MAAVSAHDVGWFHLAAFRAGLELLGFEGVMRPARAGARVGMFAFGYGHGKTCIRAETAIFVEFVNLRQGDDHGQGRWGLASLLMSNRLV